MKKTTYLSILVASILNAQYNLIDIENSQKLPFTGLAIDGNGIAGWEEGHSLDILQPLADEMNIDYMYAHKQIASRNNIDENDSYAMIGDLDRDAAGFVNFTQALQENEISPNHIGIRFDSATLGADIDGQNWEEDINSSTEWRVYTPTIDAKATIYVDNHPIVNCPLPTIYELLNSNNVLDIGDDQISGYSDFCILENATNENTPEVYQNIANAILEDVEDNREVRFRFDSIQAIPTLNINDGFIDPTNNSLLGGYYEIKNGTVEAHPRVNQDVDNIVDNNNNNDDELIQKPSAHITLHSGWNLMGIGMEPIDLQATFANTPVELVWGYDNIDKEWIGYSPNENIMQNLENANYPILEHIPPFVGYWVKLNSEEPIEIKLINSNPLETQILIDKDLFVYNEHSLNLEKINFNEDGTATKDIAGNGELDNGLWEIDGEGNIVFKFDSEEYRKYKFVINSIDEDYIIANFLSYNLSADDVEELFNYEAYIFENSNIALEHLNSNNN